MIIIKLQGGLGNQMFQYALAKYLTFVNRSELFLDIRCYINSNRKFELANFNINAKIASDKTLKQLERKSQGLIGLLRNWKFEYIKESSLRFSPEVLDFRGNLYVEGYWQSENYFKFLSTTIRQEFTLKNPIDHRLLGYEQEIKERNSISVHIRRGDYLVKDTHGICPMEYYEKAIDILFDKSKTILDKMYVFSDDIDWVIRNFKPIKNLPFVVIENFSDITSNQYLYLMSLCKHNIIANSSFSWWAAWLNPNQEKIIISPKKWFDDIELNGQAEKITPEHWLRI